MVSGPSADSDAGLREQIAQLLLDYEASVHPAPYTSERALYERLRGLVPGGILPPGGGLGADPS